MEIFFTILILILAVSVSGVVTKVIPIRIPLPLIQIAIGALLAWYQFGLHVSFDPELFMVLLIPLCYSSMAGKRQPVNFSRMEEKFLFWCWCSSW